jgi:hypothetical protein
MNININSDKLLKAIKENPMSIVIVALFLIAFMFAYMFHSERIRVSTDCDNQLNIIKDKFTQYQIECNDQLIAIRKDCRIKLDSIEDDYYRKFTLQERQIMKIEYQLDQIKNKLNTK